MATLYTVENPWKPEGTPAWDGFGRDVLIDGDYMITGAPYYNNDLGTNVGRLYGYRVSTRELLYTIESPAYNPSFDKFGEYISLSGEYFVVGVPRTSIGSDYRVGTVYVYNTYTGALIKTIKPPSMYTDARFGGDVSLSGNYLVCTGLNSSRDFKVFFINLSTGNIIKEITPPSYDNLKLDISDKYILLRDPYVEDYGASSSGKIYVYNLSGNHLRTLRNPNHNQDTYKDYFGLHTAIYGDLCLVGTPNEDEDHYDRSGVAYLFNLSTGELLHTFTNPNDYSTPYRDSFGDSVTMNKDYCIIAATGESGYGEPKVGRIYVYSLKNYELINTLYNPIDEPEVGYYLTVDMWGNRLVAGGRGMFHVMTYLKYLTIRNFYVKYYADDILYFREHKTARYMNECCPTFDVYGRYDDILRIQPIRNGTLLLTMIFDKQYIIDNDVAVITRFNFPDLDHYNAYGFHFKACAGRVPADGKTVPISQSNNASPPYVTRPYKGNWLGASSVGKSYYEGLSLKDNHYISNVNQYVPGAEPDYQWVEGREWRNKDGNTPIESWGDEYQHVTLLAGFSFMDYKSTEIEVTEFKVINRTTGVVLYEPNFNRVELISDKQYEKYGCFEEPSFRKVKSLGMIDYDDKALHYRFHNKGFNTYSNPQFETLPYFYAYNLKTKNEGGLFLFTKVVKKSEIIDNQSKVLLNLDVPNFYKELEGGGWEEVVPDRTKIRYHTKAFAGVYLPTMLDFPDIGGVMPNSNIISCGRGLSFPDPLQMNIRMGLDLFTGDYALTEYREWDVVMDWVSSNWLDETGNPINISAIPEEYITLVFGIEFLEPIEAEFGFSYYTITDETSGIYSNDWINNLSEVTHRRTGTNTDYGCFEEAKLFKKMRREWLKGE